MLHIRKSYNFLTKIEKEMEKTVNEVEKYFYLSGGFGTRSGQIATYLNFKPVVAH